MLRDGNQATSNGNVVLTVETDSQLLLSRNGPGYNANYDKENVILNQEPVANIDNRYAKKGGVRAQVVSNLAAVPNICERKVKFMGISQNNSGSSFETSLSNIFTVLIHGVTTIQNTGNHTIQAGQKIRMVLPQKLHNKDLMKNEKNSKILLATEPYDPKKSMFDCQFSKENLIQSNDENVEELKCAMLAMNLGFLDSLAEMGYITINPIQNVSENRSYDREKLLVPLAEKLGVLHINQHKNVDENLKNSCFSKIIGFTPLMFWNDSIHGKPKKSNPLSILNDIQKCAYDNFFSILKYVWMEEVDEIVGESLQDAKVGENFDIFLSKYILQ